MDERKAPVGNGPRQDEVTRITNAIIEQLGDVDLESALTVLYNLSGQLVAALANNKPSGIQHHANNMAENIKKAAIAKTIYDDEQRRKANDAENG